MDATFDSISSVDADISVLENDIAATEDRKNRLSEEIRSARYDEQMREKASAIRQKEADRDKANSELSALNRQADTRAQLSIKRNELQSKSNQVEASYVLPRRAMLTGVGPRATLPSSANLWAPISTPRRWKTASPPRLGEYTP